MPDLLETPPSSDDTHSYGAKLAERLSRKQPEAQNANNDSTSSETPASAQTHTPLPLDELKLFLVDYMLKCQWVTRDHTFVNVLFRLCAEVNADLLCSAEFEREQLPESECMDNVSVLRDQHGRNHAAALVYARFGRHEEALAIWKECVSK